jgi:hypothetical protein
MKRLSLAGVVLSLLVTSNAFAQQAPEALFTNVDAATSNQAFSGLNALDAKVMVDRRLVGMRLDRLFAAGGARRVQLNLGPREWVAAFHHMDSDVLGHRVWVGTIEGVEYSHVAFSERNGAVAGMIDAVATKYLIRSLSPGLFTLDEITSIKGGEEKNDAVPVPASANDAAQNQMATASDAAGVIDVMILWTPAARGSSTTATMQALAAQIVSQSNTAYANSQIATSLRLVGESELSYTETPRDPTCTTGSQTSCGNAMSADLSNLRANAGVGNGRNSVGADLVQLLVSSADTPCGIGYFLETTGSYGFSVADIACVSQYTPTHEMGHNQGSHHAPEDVCSSPPCTGSGAYASYSFGYKDPVRGFRSIMAYDCSAGCPRTLNLSNPAVNHASGFPTGTTNQNNARSINETAFTVANFRQSTQVSTTTPPAAPAGLAANVSGFNVTVSWSAVTTDAAWAPSAATGYVLQVGTAPGVYNIFPAQNVGNTTSVSGSGPAATYYWRVYAYNSAGSGPASAEQSFALGSCAAPAAPAGFTHSVGAGRVVTLGWTQVAGIAYTIDAGVSPGTTIVSLAAGATAGASVQAPPGTFYVRVRATNACGATSVASAERTIVVP